MASLRRFNYWLGAVLAIVVAAEMIAFGLPAYREYALASEKATRLQLVGALSDAMDQYFTSYRAIPASIELLKPAVQASAPGAWNGNATSAQMLARLRVIGYGPTTGGERCEWMLIAALSSTADADPDTIFYCGSFLRGYRRVRSLDCPSVEQARQSLGNSIIDAALRVVTNRGTSAPAGPWLLRPEFPPLRPDEVIATMSIKAQQEKVKVGEPVNVDITITVATDRTVSWHSIYGPETHALLNGEPGIETDYARRRRHPMGGSMIASQLFKGEPFTFGHVVSRDIEMTTPGEYRTSISQVLIVDAGTTSQNSAPATNVSTGESFPAVVYTGVTVRSNEITVVVE